MIQQSFSLFFALALAPAAHACYSSEARAITRAVLASRMLVFSLLLSACGGGGSDSANTSSVDLKPPLAHATFGAYEAFNALMQTPGSYRASSRDALGNTASLEQRVSQSGASLNDWEKEHGIRSSLFLESVTDSKQAAQPRSELSQTFTHSAINALLTIQSGRLEGLPFKWTRFLYIPKAYPANIGTEKQRMLEATLYSDEAMTQPQLELRMDWSLKATGQPDQAWFCLTRNYYASSPRYWPNSDDPVVQVEERCYTIDRAGTLLGGFRAVSVNAQGQRVVYE